MNIHDLIIYLSFQFLKTPINFLERQHNSDKNLSFYLSRESFVFLHFWRKSFLMKYLKIFLPFFMLNILSFSHLAHKISVKKSIDTVIEVSLYVMGQFSLTAFKILFVINFLIMVCHSKDTFVFDVFGVLWD